MKIRIAALLLALGIPVSAFATVGGPQNIEVLGYEGLCCTKLFLRTSSAI